MDVSVLVSIGSFAVSERVLKPKASVLVVLGCILLYDLTTKTHDVSALRVYRGPAMIAFTLMMAAWSLRIWRRNGVACDELLFLPGTPYGAAVTGQDDAGAAGAGAASSTSSISATINTSTNISTSTNSRHNNNNNSEGDAAAGPPRGETDDMMILPILSDHSYNNHQGIEASPSRAFRELDIEMTTTATISSPSSPPPPARSRITSVDREENFTDEWNDDDDDDDSNNDENNNDADSSSVGANSAGLIQRSLTRTEDDDLQHTSPHNQQHAQTRTNLERFQESHPRITRIGSLFFFRTPDTSTLNATYAPSGPSVLNAGLDMTMPVLINFHLFIQSFNNMETDPMAEFTCKILPLIFLSILIVRTVVPPGRRKRFWSTMRFTAMAPFHKIRFRDAFIGDILTSLVRPFQDLLFALSYYITVVYWGVFGDLSLAEAGTALEQSWFLHNVVLPSCAILPLWWRFLQSLRSAYDNNKRWPYYGDSFKYLTAAIIILYGMTHPEGRRSAWWIVSFVAAVFYQIYWDVVMDWELFCMVPRDTVIVVEDAPQDSYLCARISSLRPTSTILLPLHMYITQPISERLRRLGSAIPTTLARIQLRPKRLYKTKNFYYRCLLLNVTLRCLWMMCFIPAYRLSKTSEKVATFSSDVNSIFGVLMPVAEILRRAHWGFIKVEMETIRMMQEDDYHHAAPYDYSRVAMHQQQQHALDGGSVASTFMDDSEMEDQSKHNARNAASFGLPFWLDAPQQNHHNNSHPSSREPSMILKVWNYIKSEQFRRKVLVVELSCWAIAFVGLGYWATY